MLNNDEQEQIEAEPMGDDDIKRYFPNADIIVYNDLSKYNTIEDLLPHDKSFCFMLIESSPNTVHSYGNISLLITPALTKDIRASVSDCLRK